ncbi:hypothetical protein Ddye_027870 [Dipteronia dyeriana]|uniref:Disease resistance N-terminal domain-containing protein n=1 Tax=Dipteronia dyeriana TaxID=168575 RepID=A0AAD9TQU8_9ROSI|nr:hypothetical protein Ddye_027870 [Dipteronia dyeriana]
MPVGEVFLSAFLQVLFDRLAPNHLSFFSIPDLAPELQKLNKKLLKIEAVLADAEEKQLSGDKLVKMWLDDLQDLSYDLDDLLDEFATQELERKLKPVEPQSTLLRIEFLLDPFETQQVMENGSTAWHADTVPMGRGAVLACRAMPCRAVSCHPV